jgi:hypothetical protein
VVGVLSRQRAGKPRNRDSIYRRGNRFISSLSVQIIAGAHPASNVILTWTIYSEVKRPGREIEQSPTSTAEVKNE